MLLVLLVLLHCCDAHKAYHLGFQTWVTLKECLHANQSSLQIMKIKSSHNGSLAEFQSEGAQYFGNRWRGPGYLVRV